MKSQLTIPSTDNYPLSALLFKPTTTSKGSILICTGLGIPKEFYERYAAFLAEQGYIALVFDYRGIGKLPQDFSADTINLRNWGIKDMVATTDWLKTNYPTQKIYLFGHSIGGQIAGLMHNYDLIERYFFFCSTAGYWRLFAFPMNFFSLFMWYVHIPVTTNLLGYMPKSLTYRGVSMAKGVALEWAAWSRKKKYISAFFNNTIDQEYYNDITQKIAIISFTDDPIATDRAMKSILSYYKNAPIEKHRINPSDFGLGRIGHSGFFTRKANKKLWRLPLDLIET